jgi:hypothetical protein
MTSNLLKGSEGDEEQLLVKAVWVEKEAEMPFLLYVSEG